MGGVPAVFVGLAFLLDRDLGIRPRWDGPFNDLVQPQKHGNPGNCAGLCYLNDAKITLI